MGKSVKIKYDIVGEYDIINRCHMRAIAFTYFVLFRDLVFEIALSVFECLRVYPSNCL